MLDFIKCILQASPLPPLEGLECGLLENCLDQVEAGLSYPDSGYSDSVKSEPASPASSSQDPSPPLSPVLQVLQSHIVVNTISSGPSTAVYTIDIC